MKVKNEKKAIVDFPQLCRKKRKNKGKMLYIQHDNCVLHKAEFGRCGREYEALCAEYDLEIYRLAEALHVLFQRRLVDFEIEVHQEAEA